ncbi:hypothetical protein DFH07DRAFT_960007 [Mycena maculata]|uniref:Uncharacterized protein n=1 Tax=Mycena maculata TaxID=230809 RepID=A0AAD7NC00_9AGAR|nr:hypothetical protein DFH07DRAFT_960007 [Mycena maculata]
MSETYAGQYGDADEFVLLLVHAALAAGGLPPIPPPIVLLLTHTRAFADITPCTYHMLLAYPALSSTFR